MNQETKIIAGIDPGKTGGITILDENSNVKECIIMPSVKDGKKNILDMATISSILKAYMPIIYIENVHAMPGQGVTSMFSFGRGMGQLEGICAALGLEVNYVSPQKWKNTLIGKLPKKNKEELDLLGKVEKKEYLKQYEKDKKQAAIDKAKELAPGETFLATSRSTVPSDGMAESLLIAKFGELDKQ
jgi:hypothetical protein